MLDAHSREQGALLAAYVLERRTELERKQGDEWSAAGPRSVSPFVPCADGRIPHVLRAARLGADDVLWDLGCGDGRVLHQAAVQYGCACVGVDIDAECIREARERAAECGVADRCAFAACDLLALRPGALASGELGAAVAEADRGVRTPPPTCVIVFVTGHALARLSALLRAEWEGGALRIVSCVESLDACVDYESGPDALFGGEDARAPWAVSRAHEPHGIYVVPPRATSVAEWEAAEPAAAAAAAPTRAEADGAAWAVLPQLLSEADVAALDALAEALAAEQGDLGADLPNLFDDDEGADASRRGGLFAAAEDRLHAAAEHRVTHLHRGGAVQRALLALLRRVRARVLAADASRWRLLLGRSTALRSVEHHRYTRGGSVGDAEHRDAGSLLTLSVALSAPHEYEGGELSLWAPAEPGGAAAPQTVRLARGDGVLFPSEKRHSVSTVSAGERCSFVLELWEGPPNEFNRHH